MAEKKNNVANLFQMAKEFALPMASDSSGKKAGKDDKVVVDLGDDLTTLATVKVLGKSLEKLAEKYDCKIKEKMADEFAKQAATVGRKPSNFVGKSSKAEASCELRRRSSSSVLTSGEMDLLKTMEIPLGEEVVQTAVPERYFINPDLLSGDDGTLAKKISAALASVPELKDKEDIICKQPAMEEVKRPIVTEESINAVAALKEPSMIRELLPIVSVLAIRAKLVTTDLDDALGILKTMEVAL